jgi:GTPase SAR1 family protein
MKIFFQFLNLIQNYLMKMKFIKKILIIFILKKEELKKIKIIILGEENVGKTTLKKSIINKNTNNNELSTIGIDIDEFNSNQSNNLINNIFNENKNLIFMILVDKIFINYGILYFYQIVQYF